LGLNKKGYIGDVLLWIVVIGVFSMAAIMTYMMNSEIKTAVDAEPSITANAKTQVDNIVTPMPAWIDGVVAILIFGSAITLFFSVLLIRDFPGFFVFIWILVGIMILVAAILSNTYFEFLQDPDVAVAAADFTFLNFIMNNYVIAAIFWGVSLGAAMLLNNQT